MRDHGGYQHLSLLVIVFDVPRILLSFGTQKSTKKKTITPATRWLLGIQAGWRAGMEYS
jgi:hypothetical protein